MKIRLAAAMLASLCAVATPAFAAGQTGFIRDLYVRDSDGLILVDLFGPADFRVVHPACASQTYWVIPSETTESGKRLFATLLAALIAGEKITIYGKNTCTRWANGEDIDTVGVQGVL
jgi:hypothetical protein